MTKVFALLSIAAMFAFASCADKKEEATTTVDTAVVVPVEAAPMADSATAAPAADSVATAAPAEAPKH